MTRLSASTMAIAFDELRGCLIRRPGHTCEVRKEFLTVALEVLGEVIGDAQADRSPKGHDPAEGHGRNDESPFAATSGDAPEGS